jgi:hypothetical protein
MKAVNYVLLSMLIIFISCSREKDEEITINKFEDTKGDVINEDLGEEPGNNTSSGEISNLERITTGQVKTRIGDSLIVEGLVADIYMSNKVAYLNFDDKFPKNSIAGTIFANKFGEFGDLGRFKNKRIEMRGKISTYKNKPQIILQSSDQVRILD